MNFDRRAIQAHALDADGQDLLGLQPCEDSVQDPRFAPTVHSGVDGVPVAEVLGQSAPLAAVLYRIKESVDQLQVGQAYVAALARQAIGDTIELLLGEFHAQRAYLVAAAGQLVLTDSRRFLLSFAATRPLENLAKPIKEAY